MIGNSLPCSRNVAACVPLMFVRIVLATPDTDRPSSAAFGRSTRIASSGRPSSRPSCGLAMPGVSRMHREHVLRRRASDWSMIFAADFDGQAAVVLPPPPSRARELLVAARGARRDRDARDADEHAAQVGGDLSLVRVRSSRGVSCTVT